MKHKLCAILSAVLLCALCVAPAYALEYTFGGADDYLFGRPTSDHTIYEWKNPNMDRSRNAALIPPGSSTPTSCLPNSGEHLVPDPGLSQTAGVETVNGSTAAVTPPFPWTVSGLTATGFTDVTPDLYYSDGSLGILKIPSIGVAVGIFEGTDTTALAKGAGHFEGTSIWDGNCALAGHNRGTHGIFGELHTLNTGDVITLTTRLGTRTYAVSSVTKVSAYDISGLTPSATNVITIYTCVADQPDYRWCVRGAELAV